ncbi:MAG: lysyl-tRNA synthetase class 2 [Bacteriovoracaceae bacterium]|jgi:lysyl-tRNA synthetase class 2
MKLFTGLRDLKTFFNNQGFLEVITPPMVQNPGMEVHIHPFKVTKAIDNIDTDWFLQTSPEFAMKELLSEGFEKIYNISYSFRDEPESSTHRPQFLMLEWYRANEDYQKIKMDCSNLVTSFPNSSFKEVEEVNVEELFLEYCSMSILDFLETKDLYQKIHKDFPQLAISKELPWEDLFFMLFLNLIEPQFKNHPALIVDKYPAPLSALSTLNKEDQRVCERFELYLNGVEVANCFNELTDLNVQRTRFEKDAFQKKNSYGYELPSPQVLYNALEKGLPPSAGIAMGVERFLMAMNNEENLFY